MPFLEEVNFVEEQRVLAMNDNWRAESSNYDSSSKNGNGTIVSGDGAVAPFESRLSTLEYTGPACNDREQTRKRYK